MRKSFQESERQVLALEKIPCQLNIQIFIMFSVIVSLKPGSCCWLNFCPSKSEKLNRATKFFIGSMAMKLSLLMITLITKKGSIDGF